MSPPKEAEATGLARQVVDKLIPDAPSSLKEKHRWMQPTVKNATQFPLLLTETYFDSGRYWDAPGNTSPFEQLVFSCCNHDHSVLTGASGGNAWELVLDDQHRFKFALGWTVPEFGGYKAGVVESSSPKDGYDVATTTGGSIWSRDHFEGKDKDGNPQKIRFFISAAPSQFASFVLTEVKI